MSEKKDNVILFPVSEEIRRRKLNQEVLDEVERKNDVTEFLRNFLERDDGFILSSDYDL